MSVSLDRLIEAILFATARSFTVSQLAHATDSSSKDVENALQNLTERLKESGIMLQYNGKDIELVTCPATAETVTKLMNAEVQGELTRSALEALTILAYRGPLTRPELEQIRGINSAIILRNLMLRGLVEQREDTKLGQPTYSVTFDFLNYLGLSNVEGLPEYDQLRGNETVTQILTDLESVAEMVKPSHTLNV